MEGEVTTHLGLGVFGVVDLAVVVPVLGLLGLGVLDLLDGQEVPVLLQRAGLHLLVVNLHLIGLVGVQDQRVQMGQLVILDMKEKGRARECCIVISTSVDCYDLFIVLTRNYTLLQKLYIYLALDLLLDEVINTLVVEDDMDLFGAVATDVRACTTRANFTNTAAALQRDGWVHPTPGLKQGS